MGKDAKVLFGTIVVCTVVILGVVGSVVKPVVKTEYVPRVVVATPTASPSATASPSPRVLRSIQVTKPVTTVTVAPLQK